MGPVALGGNRTNTQYTAVTRHSALLEHTYVTCDTHVYRTNVATEYEPKLANIVENPR